MNERIKQLAIQAGFFYEDYKDIWYLEYHNESCEEEMEKFAQLIVRECMEVVEKQLGGGNGDGVEWDRAINFTYDDMKQHFGVEE
jgi:hypothetical protein